MSIAETYIPAPIILSDNAATRVKVLVNKEGNDQLMLRVYITGGGCSGFQYGFNFDQHQAEDDTVIEHQGARMVVDSMSFQYLVGATIDYVEGLEGSRFIVTNPNATTTCGCGMSFNL